MSEYIIHHNKNYMEKQYLILKNLHQTNDFNIFLVKTFCTEAYLLNIKRKVKFIM